MRCFEGISYGVGTIVSTAPGCGGYVEGHGYEVAIAIELSANEVPVALLPRERVFFDLALERESLRDITT